MNWAMVVLPVPLAPVNDALPPCRHLLIFESQHACIRKLSASLRKQGVKDPNAGGERRGRSAEFLCYWSCLSHRAALHHEETLFSTIVQLELQDDVLTRRRGWSTLTQMRAGTCIVYSPSGAIYMILPAMFGGTMIRCIKVGVSNTDP